MGVWSNETERFNKRVRIPVMILLLAIVYVLPQSYALTKVVGDLTLVIDNVTVNFTGVVCSLKIYFLFKSRKSKKFPIVHFTLFPSKKHFSLFLPFYSTNHVDTCGCPDN